MSSYLSHLKEATNIQEGYLLSDKNISINLNQFESGKQKKLLIIGLPGSGKTSLGEHLMKKYKIKNFVSDTDWKTMYKGITNSKRTIVEGAGLADLYYKEQTWRDIIIDKPMILMGMSAIKAGFRADKRDGMLPSTVKDKKDMYYFIRKNLSHWEKVLKYLRKDVMNIPNADIKEYKVPKFKPVYY